MNQPPSLNERRQFERIPKEVTVQANMVTYPVNETDFSDGRSKNLSEGGILLQLSTEFNSGAILQVKITLPGWRRSHPGFIKVTEDSIGSPFTAICEVVRSRKIGDIFETAVRFINIDEDDFKALRGYLKKQASSKKEVN